MSTGVYILNAVCWIWVGAGSVGIALLVRRAHAINRRIENLQRFQA